MNGKSSQETYPLSSLFLLTAAVAIVLAMYGPALREANYGTPAALGLVAFWGGLLGMMLGAHHYRRARGALTGLMTGGVSSVLVAPLVWPNERPLSHVIAVTLAGCGMLIALGLGIRWTTRENHEEEGVGRPEEENSGGRNSS